MRKPRIGHLAPLFGLALGLAGCRGHEAAPYPTWATAPPPYTPQSGSPNAFDGYALAALQVEQTAGKHLTRVSFYPQQKESAIKACAPAVAEIAKASHLPCDFRFVARPPFMATPYQAGWRLLGRVMRWRIEAACSKGEYDAAIDDTVLATRFGFDLTGGGATDASLGFAILDDARRALSPWLSKMTVVQLNRLADGAHDALKRKPLLGKTIEHEGENMRLRVQALQDAYQKGDLSAFGKNLGPDVKEALKYLDELHHASDAKRAAYFQGLAKEGETELRYLAESAARPTAEREAEPKPDKELERPWKRLAHHFFMTARPLLAMDDRAVARTRLLVLTARLLAVQKETKSYPRTLGAFPPDVTVDPFTGRPFLYRADATQFLLYSVSDNLRDDGGDTDETFTEPDLTLERKD